MGSGFKTFTAGSVLTASDVNNYLMTQGVMYFASTTARDAAITSPVAGMVAYINSGDTTEGLYTYNGTAWRQGPGWNAPWGLVATTVSMTSNYVSTIGTETAITSATITFTAVANRTYRIVLHEPLIANEANNIHQNTLRFRYTNTSGTIIQEQAAAASSQGYTQHAHVSVNTTMTAGSKTIICTHQNSSGVYKSTLTRSATAPAVFYIEDIGPAGNPA